MGIAFWTVAAWQVTGWMTAHRTGRMAMAGAALGLATGAHMTEAFAAAALALSFLTIYLLDQGRQGPRGALNFITRTALPFCGVFLAVAVTLLWAPLRQPDIIDGMPDYPAALRTLLSAVLFYRRTILTSSGRVWNFLWTWCVPALFVLLALMAMTVAWILFRWAHARRLDELPELDRNCLLFSLSVLLAFLLLWIEPRLLHHPYFAMRRLVFTLPVVSIGFATWARWFSVEARAAPVIAYVPAFVSTLLSLQFALEFNVSWYKLWEFDAGTKTFARILRDRRPPQPSSPIRVTVDERLGESLDFYRALYGLDWIEPATLGGTLCLGSYYIGETADLARLARVDRPLHRDVVSGMVLAESDGRELAGLRLLREIGFRELPDCALDIAAPEAWIEWGHPGARRHVLRGFMAGNDDAVGTWTYLRPALLFHVPAQENQVLKIDFVLAAQTFQQTGPVRLTVKVNGETIGNRLYTTAGQQTFEQAVAPELLRSDGLTLVETDLDKYFVAKKDEPGLGYLFLRGGFVTRPGMRTAQSK
jgi:hypothetical protein